MPTQKYTVIMLILDSEDLKSYSYNRLIWKSYMNSDPNILSLFVRYDNTIIEDKLSDSNKNLLLIKGIEKYECQSIYDKTINAFKFCEKHYNYRYIVRTNISSFWVFDSLLNFLF